MCGIAGIIDLSGKRRPTPAGAIRAMADAIIHRGPDEDGYLERPGLAFASRRLSIVGLSDGRQPIFNEDRSVAVVFNGELFDYPEMKAELEARGHRFATHCDTEIIPHRWEDHQDGMFEHLRGQYAVALWDEKRRRVVLGRDRVGICPLYWTRQASPEGEWLLFASEIKALLASAMVETRPDPLGINHLFTFLALPGPVSCFQGIQALTPGHYLSIQLGGDGESARVEDRTYWRLDFPDWGQEYSASSLTALSDEFEGLLLDAVKRRLRADVPVVSYISGGVDSSIVVAMSSKVRGEPIASFTISIEDHKLNEVDQAQVTARHVGTKPIIVKVGPDEVLNTYPRLIRAAEGPVVDTSCTALLLLAQEVHAHNYKVALTGEGADEWLAGYSWHKVNRLFGFLDCIPGVRLSGAARGMMMAMLSAPPLTQEYMDRADRAVGGHNGWHDFYTLMTLNKGRFYSPWMLEATKDHVPFEDLGFEPERMRRWHPLNRELCVSGRCHLPGLLLNAKGDRVAMHSSVETRYPFLDEAVVAFLAKVDPRWKLHGFREKYLLRKTAERWLPHEVAWRPKGMFRAPFDSFHLEQAPAFVNQLLSEESLRKTGYFDPQTVEHYRRHYRRLRVGGLARASVEMGLVAVTATQMWHQTFFGGGLADLPTFRTAGGEERAAGVSRLMNGSASRFESAVGHS
ncbi:MAG TPA: asparagine synthase (glutamine-hydrolyzing) [Gemmataceae bacterium]|nr:asparagine synthase (glutamine-hydrolyzing) [Gemmataceae bacterium]